VQEAALAWAQGKRVETKHPIHEEWGIIAPVGSEDGVFSGKTFACADWLFRLAPEPPAKRFRPWTAEEVPVGALIRTKGAHFIHMIVALNTAKNQVYGGLSWAGGVAYCLEHAEHSTDNGKTWLPCGVEVTE
jgi:hypothetical protein